MLTLAQREEVERLVSRELDGLADQADRARLAELQAVLPEARALCAAFRADQAALVDLFSGVCRVGGAGSSRADDAERAPGGAYPLRAGRPVAVRRWALAGGLLAACVALAVNIAVTFSGGSGADAGTGPADGLASAALGGRGSDARADANISAGANPLPGPAAAGGGGGGASAWVYDTGETVQRGQPDADRIYAIRRSDGGVDWVIIPAEGPVLRQARY